MADDFLSMYLGLPPPDERTAWLRRQDARLNDTLDYYFGPSGVPDKLRSAANLAYFTDAGDMAEAADASREIWNDPSLANTGRYLTAAAALAIPAVSARGMGVFSDAADSAVDDIARYLGDEAGGIRGWHGSPHLFYRFDSSKIGTGEGAQAYGRGLYIGEARGTGEAYRDSLARPYYATDDGVSIAEKYGADVLDVFEKAGGDPKDIYDTIARLRAIVQRNVDDFGVTDVSQLRPQFQGDLASTTIEYSNRADKLEELINSGDVNLVGTGHLYEVNINADPADFLDWDAPLPLDSPLRQAIRENAERVLETASFGSTRNEAKDAFLASTSEYLTGQGAYRSLSLGRSKLGNLPDQRAASEALREAGIPGIKYLDAGSRAAGDGTRNYVVFDDKLIDILGRNGVRDTPAGRGQDILDLLTSGRASEVTDEMLDMGDPVLNARLNEYLWNNYDLPMDEASRMARAGDTDAFHATRSDRDFSAFEPGWRGSNYFAATPRDAEVGALGGAQDFAQVDLGGATAIIPVKLHGDEVARLRPPRQMWDALPDQAFVHNESDLAKSVGARYSEDVYSWVYSDTGDPKIVKRPYPEQQYTRDTKAWTGAMLPGWNEGSDVASLQRTADAYGQKGFLVSDEAGASIVAGPGMSIRSRFARFDPRLRHLRNLNAGLAVGAMPLSYYLMQDDDARNPV